MSKKKEINDITELTSFPFFRSYAEALEPLEDNQRLSLFDGIVMYAFYGVAYQPIDDKTRLAFTLIKPILDSNIKKVLGGSKGGRPSKVSKEEIEETKEKVKTASFLKDI